MTDSSNGSDPRGGDNAGAEDAASITVQAVRPHRDKLEIRFPRVIGYRLELPEERPTASKDGQQPKAVLDPCNPEGSTAHVRFETTKTHRYETDPRRCHVNWIVLDSSWEEEFCRVVEAHPQVLSYVKNHNLGLEVPYLHGSEQRTYIPDFIVLIDDGQGPDDPLRLVVDIKGFRKKDAKRKKAAMESYWVPGVNRHARYGHWGFAEFREVLELEADLDDVIENRFGHIVRVATGDPVAIAGEALIQAGGSDPDAKYIPRRRPWG